MDTLVAPIQMFNLAEPIPGYRLQQRLGAGGYGEVWRAEAPGGLHKAVKIVHGPLGESRAERELKALQRIRLVQHPLLLSLERFEVVDNHLVIVTELAHGSLKDRFQERVGEGLRGIPREELLAYLRDVAESLDYLYEHHSLQHLDVKPENLLLIADRVKVADFGLVKDLHDQSASLIGGLTPVYAPPELFDGRPNQFSDQYSLAIVYQELLTGELPFHGRTLAQLAAQHLHAHPCLDVLPRADQPLVGRALSKDPQRRFANCRELISKLTEAPRAALKARRASSASTAAVPRGESPAANTTTTINTQKTVRLPEPDHVRLLPPVTWDAAAQVHRPTLIVGLGRTGAVVLRKLRSRLCERLDDLAPAIEMLLLDTDLRALTEAGRGDRSTAIPHSQTVCLPLKSPQAYRENSQAILEWMNRRWLYNIPRSLQTEGVRPLGRLAFVDHFATVVDALQQALSRIVGHQSLAESREKMGVEFSSTPQIFVVAAVGGGTGSGIVLDLSYTLQLLLGQMKLSHAPLHGLLMFSTPRRSGSRDLAIANGLCLLNELACYASSHGYPGEPACNLPASAGGQGPFSNTYLIHLGDDLTDDQWETRVGAASEYLYQNIATPAASFFELCRSEISAAPTAAPAVRTFGMARIGEVDEVTLHQQTAALCQALIEHWMGKSTAQGISPELYATQQATNLAHAADLDPEVLCGWANELIRRQLGGEPRVFARQLVLESRMHARGSAAAAGSELSKRLAAAIDAALFGRDGTNELSLQALLEANIETARREKADLMREWLTGVLNTPTMRVGGAQRAARCLRDCLTRLEQDLLAESAQVEQLASALPLTDDDETLAKYAAIRLRQLADRSALRLVRGIDRELAQSHERLQDLARRLRQVAAEVVNSATSASSNGRPTVQAAGPEHLPEQYQLELVTQLDRELTEILAQRGISWSSLLEQEGEAWSQFQKWLPSAAQRACRTAAAHRQVALLTGQPLSGATHPASAMRTLSEGAPRLLACGGSKRTLLVGPQGHTTPDSWHKPLEDAIGSPATVIQDSDAGITICWEVQDVPLCNVAAYLAQGRSDYLKVASRVHTRIDVDWPPLGDG